MSYLYPWIISSLISCNKYAPKSIKVTFFQINVFKNCTFLRVRRSTICDTRQQTAPPKNKVHVPRKSLHSQIPKTKRATNIRWNVSFMPNLVRTDHWPHIKAINQSGNCQFIKIICSIRLWEENNYKVKKSWNQHRVSQVAPESTRFPSVLCFIACQSRKFNYQSIYCL